MAILDDKNHPWRKDGANDESLMRMFAAWLKGQQKINRARFCIHGQYVGADRALAYKCERCPET